MKKLLLLLCACSPLAAMQEDDTKSFDQTFSDLMFGHMPLAPTIYQRLLQHSIQTMHADPTLPPVRTEQLNTDHVAGKVMETIGRQIIVPAWPKYISGILFSYPEKKGIMHHEVAHTLGEDDEKKADHLAMQNITCYRCAHEFAQMHPSKSGLKHTLLSAWMSLMLRISGHTDHNFDQYLSYEDFESMIQRKDPNCLCDYHRALQQHTMYQVCSRYAKLATYASYALAVGDIITQITIKKRVPKKLALTFLASWAVAGLAKTFIEHATEQRVASGELEP